MSKFTDFIDDLKKLEKKFLEIDQYESPQNTLEGFSYAQAIKRGVNEFFNNIVINIKGLDKKINFICSLIPNNISKNELTDLFSIPKRIIKHELKIDNYNQEIDKMIADGMKLPEILNEINTLAEKSKEPGKNDALNKIIGALLDKTKGNYYNDESKQSKYKIEGLIDKLNKDMISQFSEEELDSFVPSKDVYKSVFTDDDIETYPESDKISELITKYPNDKETLEKANRLLSTICIKKHSNFGDVAEKAGATANEIFKNITLKECEKKGIKENDLLINRSNVELKSEYGSKDYVESLNKITNTSNKVSENVKKQIKEIYSIIKEKLYNENSVDIHGSAFFPIRDARIKLREAIDSKDIKKIKECTENLEKQHNLYTDLLKKCRNVGKNSLIVSNISAARGGELTGEMARDVIGNSRLGAMFYLEFIEKHVGISLDKMLDDPIGALKEGTERLMFGKESISSKIVTDNNNNIYKIIKSLANPGQKKIDYQKVAGDLYSTLEFGIESIILCNASENTNELSMAYNMYKINVIDRTNAEINGGEIFYKCMKNNPKEYIKNLLVAKKEDFSVAKLNPEISNYLNPSNLKFFEKFNATNYLREKGDFYETLLKVNDLKQGMRENKKHGIPTAALEAMNEICTEITNSRKAKSEIFSKALDKIKNNKSLKNTELESLKAEGRFKSLNNGGIDKANLVETIKVYADLKRKYESRNFFAKIFYSNVKNQAKLVQSMEEKIIASGFEKQALDSAINNYYANNRVEFENIVTINSETIKSNDSKELLETDLEDNILDDNTQLENDGEEFKVDEYERDKSI